ncbi:unnamed protein product [Ilex paraguariensis]|uniref:BHLH domain-containing protein n=1 Tax=Ilex paraguariensis TaxID=185542 RepID=A0ABC8SW05_9AQUA
MEREFGNEFSPAFNVDNTSIDGMYSGMSFQTLLSVNPEKILFPSLDNALYTSLEYPYGATTSTISDPVTFGFSSEAFPTMNADDQKLKSVGFIQDSQLNNGDFAAEESSTEPPFNFILKTEPFDFISHSDSSFRQLPYHPGSLEELQDDFAIAESSNKRATSLSLPQIDLDTLNSIIRNFQMSNNFGPYKPVAEPTRRPPSSALARQRRQRISEKTRCLQKVLPWDKKMDMATMLEEAYKYVHFLQAQIRVLQSMPCDSLSFETRNPINVSAFGGILAKLNRQQLLEVLVNSPVAQTAMYSQGCCVYSIEQLVLLKKIAQRKALYQQMFYDPSLLP